MILILIVLVYFFIWKKMNIESMSTDPMVISQQTAGQIKALHDTIQQNLITQDDVDNVSNIVDSQSDQIASLQQNLPDQTSD